MNNIFIPPDAAGMRLIDWMIKNNHSITADCGGRGTCGKCRVKVIHGEFLRYSNRGTAQDDALLYKPDAKGTILACRALCPPGGAIIIPPEITASGLITHSHPTAARKGFGATGYGIALDIGTTTLAATLLNRETGEIIDTHSCLNPQRSYGADVISRIKACRDGHLNDLCNLIRTKTSEIINIFAAKNPGISPVLLCVSGNTTMLHIFCGVSPDGIGSYPFTPVFTERKDILGVQIGLPIEHITVLPSAAAYIGSDITGGILASGMLELDGASLLVDIGTNGEMVLCTGRLNGARLIAAATAAGPALEGANISCGVGGIPGAVSHVLLDNSVYPRLTYKTIGDKAPAGICGCGLIYLISTLLDTRSIDETGFMEEGEYPLCGVPSSTALHISEDGNSIHMPDSLTPVVLTQKDVREFQLAKSALYAGFFCLLDYAELTVDKLERIYIAGGLGYYMNISSAVRTGLLPSAPYEKFSVVGNASLAGAELSLGDVGAIDRISVISEKVRVLDLNTLPLFSDLFMQNMTFPE